MADRALSILNREANVGLTFEIAPLLLTERPGAWTPVESLALAAREFDDVPVQEVTAFVAVRARSESPPLERTRLLLARLNLSEAALDQRDDAVRQEIMATADPAAVLAALVRGLAHLRAGQAGPGRQTGDRADSIHWLLGETHLEGLLQSRRARTDRGNAAPACADRRGGVRAPLRRPGRRGPATPSRGHAVTAFKRAQFQEDPAHRNQAPGQERFATDAPGRRSWTGQDGSRAWCYREPHEAEADAAHSCLPVLERRDR